MKRKTLKNNVVTKVVAGLLAVVVFWGRHRPRKKSNIRHSPAAFV